MPRLQVLFLHAVVDYHIQPAQRCATAQVPEVFTKLLEHPLLMWPAHTTEVRCYSCSENMHSRSDSHEWAVSSGCSHFAMYRILYFDEITWPWTDIKDYMLMTEVEVQFTGQMGQLPLF